MSTPTPEEMAGAIHGIITSGCNLRMLPGAHDASERVCGPWGTPDQRDRQEVEALARLIREMASRRQP